MLKKRPLPILDALVGQEGFIEIPLRIVKKGDRGEGYFFVMADALFREQRVSLTLLLAKGIKGATISGDTTYLFLKDAILFRGGTRDNHNLLRAMSHIYGFPDSNLKFKQEKKFVVLNQNRKKVNYRRGRALFKIFLKSKSIDAEIFFNFEFKEKMVYLSEKDTDYRENILEILKVGGN